ncbi:MAG: DsrE family protein [Candidatus Lokiarchaeota archaeon]
MVNSILILCDTSPVGKNSAVEAIRLGSGFVALGEEIPCEIVFMGDAVYLFNKNADPTAVNMDPNDETIEMADLSDLSVNILEEDLKAAGLTEEDLIDYENLRIISKEELIEKMNNTETCFRV